MPCKGNLIVSTQFIPIGQNSVSNYSSAHEKGVINQAECVTQDVLNVHMCW